MNTTETNAPRLDVLREIARVNAEVPEERFDMDAWWLDEKCHTAGCAIGNYCQAHPEAELKLVKDGIYLRGLIPEYRGEDQFWAVAAFLNISYDDASELFDPASYKDGCDRDTVVARIDAFIAKHTPQPVIEMKPEELSGKLVA